jgi:hypothetical protein
MRSKLIVGTTRKGRYPGLSRPTLQETTPNSAVDELAVCKKALLFISSPKLAMIHR